LRVAALKLGYHRLRGFEPRTTSIRYKEARTMRLFIPAILGLMLSSVMLPASAQTVDSVGPHSRYCGSWQNGVFTPNGNCIEETTVTTTTTTNAAPPPMAPVARERSGRVLQRLRGTITAVNGHMVTLQQSTQTLVVNDTPALSREDSGRVAVGRQVTAHGYWEDGTFYATRFE
jgi:hypothetical protein